MLLPPQLPPPSLPRAKLYRLFLQHLRFLPDPQVWTTSVPRFRKLLETPGPSPSGSNPSDNDESHKVVEIREWRREKALKKAHKVRWIVLHLPGLTPGYVLQELNKLRAAVACHPHALARLLEESYGQRGNLRWQRLQVGFFDIRSSQSIHPPLSIGNICSLWFHLVTNLAPPSAHAPKASTTPTGRFTTSGT